MKCIGAMLTDVSFSAVVWSRHTTLSISCVRESVSRDETKYWLQKRLCFLAFLQQREDQNYLSKVSYLKCY